MRQSEREKNILIEELTAQNSRLNMQLQVSRQAEMEITKKLQDVNDKYCLQNSSLQVRNKKNLQHFYNPIYVVHNYVENLQKITEM